MGVLRVLSHHGDDRVAWDHTAAVAGDPEAVAAVKEAERIFEEHGLPGLRSTRLQEYQPRQRRPRSRR